MAEWYYRLMGEDVGPLTSKELRQHVRQGKISRESFVRKDSSDWVSADTVKGLFDVAEKMQSRTIASSATAESPITSMRTPPKRHCSRRLPEIKRRYFAFLLVLGCITLALIGVATFGFRSGIDSFADSIAINEDLANQYELELELAEPSTELRVIDAHRDQTSRGGVPGVSDTTPSRSRVRSGNTSPEPVLLAYFAARTWQERLPFVIVTDATKEQMASLYGNERLDVLTAGAKILHIDDPAATPNAELTATVEINGVMCTYFLIRSGDEFKIDWHKSVFDEHARQQQESEAIRRNIAMVATQQLAEYGRGLKVLMQAYSVAIEMSEASGGAPTNGIEYVNSHPRVKRFLDQHNAGDWSLDGVTKALAILGSNDSGLSPGLIRLLNELYLNVLEMKALIDEPRGTAVAYRKAYHDLAEKHDRLIGELGNKLGIDVDGDPAP